MIDPRPTGRLCWLFRSVLFRSVLFRSVLCRIVICSMLLVAGCRNDVREDLSYDYNVVQTWSLDQMGGLEIVQFETVAWAPEQTVDLRRMIMEEDIANGRKVLEIYTATGVLSLLCQQYGASTVVATDPNPAAVACARYNAANLQLDQTMEVRQADAQSLDAFSGVEPQQKFDLIIAHPPSADGPVNSPADCAFFDPQYQLLESLLEGLPQHLNPAGRCLLSYCHRAAIEKAKETADNNGWSFQILDDRELDSLPPQFLRGMVVEIKLPIPKVEPTS